MDELNQFGSSDAIPAGYKDQLQSPTMSERLLRVERLIEVLDAKGVHRRGRARFLHEKVGSSVQYWHAVLAGSKSFGERVARRAEECLGLVRGTLEEDGLPPDAAALAAAFNALPNQTDAEFERRKRLYYALIAMIAAYEAGAPNAQ